jgi:RNA polymerase sigma-70 factor (ECF subfamily)
MDFDECLRLARCGDQAGLAGLWRTHQALVLRYFRGRIPHLADDLSSTVWVDVVRGLHSFSGDADDFRGWLFTIAHRRLVDEVRRRNLRPETMVADIGEAADGTDVEIDATSLDGALALVRRLPPDQAEAVLLRVVADLDVATVARIMNRREGSVRVLVHRGLEKLSELCQKPVTNATVPTMSEVS